MHSVVCVVSSSGYFHPDTRFCQKLSLRCTNLFVKDINGKSYQYSYGKWEPLSFEPADFYDKECGTSEIQLIQTSVGEINNCRQIQTASELFSTPPLISYAITPDGDLWQLNTYQSVKAFTVLILISLTLLGLFWGAVIVKTRREQMFDISVLAILTLSGLVTGGIAVIIVGIISLIFF